MSMKILNRKAVLTCKHVTGVVNIITPQDLVFIDNSPVLVEGDPEVKLISGCANIGLTIKPCTLSLKVDKGYSAFIYISGRKICLDTIEGLTDGTPPGTVKYIVRNPGQKFVETTA